MRWGVGRPGRYRVLFGGRMPDDLVTGPAHGAGTEPLEAVTASLAASAEGPRAVLDGAAMAGGPPALDQEWPESGPGGGPRLDEVKGYDGAGLPVPVLPPVALKP
ncbi:hypothetical protein [Streptomyces flavovirens]|uniref:TetR-like C-terminal domain-containing protein n=1 Tax=Streptomyces flavovirens TaxID=52258 RepID=UPI0031EDC992